MEKHFTATVYIVDNQKVLLIYHRKLNKWLPPGGHLDPNELPSDGAIREAKEETGLEIEILTQENIWIERRNAKSFPRPYLCLLEEIPERPGHPAHQHMDFVYLGRAIGGVEIQNPEETNGMKWFSLDEIELLNGEIEIFEETRQSIRKILTEEVFR